MSEYQENYDQSYEQSSIEEYEEQEYDDLDQSCDGHYNQEFEYSSGDNSNFNDNGFSSSMADYQPDSDDSQDTEILDANQWNVDFSSGDQNYHYDTSYAGEDYSDIGQTNSFSYTEDQDDSDFKQEDQQNHYYDKDDFTGTTATNDYDLESFEDQLNDAFLDHPSEMEEYYFDQEEDNDYFDNSPEMKEYLDQEDNGNYVDQPREMEEYLDQEDDRDYFDQVSDREDHYDLEDDVDHFDHPSEMEEYLDPEDDSDYFSQPSEMDEYWDQEEDNDYFDQVSDMEDHYDQEENVDHFDQPSEMEEYFDPEEDSDYFNQPPEMEDFHNDQQEEDQSEMVDNFIDEEFYDEPHELEIDLYNRYLTRLQRQNPLPDHKRNYERYSHLSPLELDDLVHLKFQQRQADHYSELLFNRLPNYQIDEENLGDEASTEPVDEDLINEIIDYVNEGKSLNWISRMLGVDKNYISQVLNHIADWKSIQGSADQSGDQKINSDTAESNQLDKGLISQGTYVSADWKAVYNNLKAKGYSLRSINKEIGCSFNNKVYSGNNMQLDAFNKLQNLVGEEIPHKIITPKDRYENFHFAQDMETAEAIGIILGDGHVGKSQVVISLNGEKEGKYISYVNNHLEKIFTKKPSNSQANDSNAHRIVFTRKGIVDELIRLGLETGNKTVNQVDVPKWIKQDRDLSKACMKGLFDTDGSIYFHKRKSYRVQNVELNFSNSSKPLLTFFAKFCEDEGISTKGNYKKGGTELFIYSKEDVIKFAELIGSEKINNFLKQHKLTYHSLGKTLRY